MVERNRGKKNKKIGREKKKRTNGYFRRRKNKERN